jgi:outer membrane lipoprotein-sorting protein
MGGVQKLAEFSSLVAKGTYSGFDTDFQKVPMELAAKAPDQRTITQHLPLGNSTTTFDGRAGWIASPDRPAPLLVVPAGKELDALRLEAQLMFPVGIKQALTNWRAGFLPATIGEKDMEVIQGTTPSGMRVKLFFDKQSGLLARVTRFRNSVVGITLTQIDYEDYRDVAEVKIPFKWTMTWTDGRSTIELSDVKANVPIAAATFARPAAARRN